MSRKPVFWRCNVCVLIPCHVMKVANMKTTPALASHKGKKYDLKQMIDHFMASPHELAIKQDRADALQQYLLLNPDKKPSDFTANSLEQNPRDVETLSIRLKQVAEVYNDLKAITLSGRTFPARSLIQGYVEHCQSLKNGEWKDYIPTQPQCRYNNPTAHKRYRSLI